MFHPLLPDLRQKSMDEIIKEMNDLYSKIRTVGRYASISDQLNIMINAYRDEYNRRIQEEIQQSNKKSKTQNKDNND